MTASGAEGSGRRHRGAAFTPAPQGAVFLEAAQATSRFRIEEGTLLLESANGWTRLTFER